MFSTAEIKERLTKAFSSLQENVHKGKLTHSKEIQAFQKYFETGYDPTKLVGTVCDATPILKEKFEKKIAKRKSLKAVWNVWISWFYNSLSSFCKSFKHLHVSTNSHPSLAVERKVAKKEKPVAKASSNTASRPTTSSSQGVPSGAAPEKTKKSSKGSGKPPLTSKKRKFSTANVILVEDDEEDTPPTPLKKKQKKNKATVSPSQTNKQQGVETNILPPLLKKTPPQPSGGEALEHIGSNASDPEPQQDKATTPLISTANQSDPSSGMNPSPPPKISGAVQNKGSSTRAQNLEADNAQNEEETSSPGEDGKRDSKHVDEKDSTGKEDSEDTPSNSPTRVVFPSDDADEDDQDSDEIEGYFQEDEDMNAGEADTEGNKTGIGDANVETVPNPIKVRRSITQTSPISLTKEEKKDLKQNDPLKYVRLMMAQRESSLEQSISGASTHSGASANEASHDELLQQVKKTVFDVDLFEELRNNVGNLIDQVCAEYHREVEAKTKILSTEKAQATEFDNSLQNSQASEELAASRKSAQAEFDTYTTSIRLWESPIAELQKKISDAKAKQAAIQGLDSTEVDDLAKHSVDYIEKVMTMNEDIARLRGVQAAVQYKIGLAKKKYDRMRATIPF
ncbi:uncharacterized protein LOC127123422 [Lathyrus oleraceus]|uniref:uncharacterized protein LOC127123422 n=1 Tax=Pisum sativum TaxID=3888 RepID=UPI0021D1555D|nr:uncharacterized protein LOC127123422 [Pisum sativum]